MAPVCCVCLGQGGGPQGPGALGGAARAVGLSLRFLAPEQDRLPGNRGSVGITLSRNGLLPLKLKMAT